MDLERLLRATAAAGAARHREALRRGAYRGASYADCGVDAATAARLEREAPRLSFAAERVVASAEEGAVKAVLRLKDGVQIETVLLSPSPSRLTACVSSQAGCGLACSFCATGLLGLARDLTAEEIADQALFWRTLVRGKGRSGPHNLVFMGMGEPLANYERVAEALRELTDPRRHGYSPGRVAVSTAGVAPAIERFAQELPAFPLAVSLHSAVDSIRDRLVPLNRAYPLARLAESLGAWLRRSPRKLMVEYVLLRDANDRPSDAEALIAYLARLGDRRRLHVNLIDFNPTATPHAPSEEARAAAFHRALRDAGFAAVRRRNRGRAIAGACGQLLGRAPGARPS